MSNVLGSLTPQLDTVIIEVSSGLSLRGNLYRLGQTLMNWTYSDIDFYIC